MIQDTQPKPSARQTGLYFKLDYLKCRAKLPLGVPDRADGRFYSPVNYLLLPTFKKRKTASTTRVDESCKVFYDVVKIFRCQQATGSTVVAAVQNRS